MSKKINQWTALCAGAVFCGSLGFAQTAAQPNEQKKSAAPQAAKTESAKQAGMVVFIDPVTHKLRPAERGEVNTLLKRQAAAPAGAAKAKTAKASRLPTANVAVRGPSGARGVILNSSQMQYMVVTRDASGGLQEECVTGDKKAQQALTAPAAKPVSQTQGELDVQ